MEGRRCFFGSGFLNRGVNGMFGYDTWFKLERHIFARIIMNDQHIVDGQHPARQGQQQPSVLSDSQMEFESATSRCSFLELWEHHPLRRNAQKREKSFMSVHKAAVQRQRFEQRGRMLKDLYEARRKAGAQYSFGSLLRLN